MGERGRGSQAHLFLLFLDLLMFFSAAAGSYPKVSGKHIHHHQHVRLRSQRLLASVSAGGVPSPLPSSSSASVFHVIEYGADPTGRTDSTAAIARAITDAFRGPSNRSLLPGIADLGGAEINFGGGTYLISRPITLPSGGGNLKIHSGSLRASDYFPTSRYMIELRSSSMAKRSGTTSSSAYHYESITIAGIMLDANYRGGGIAVVDSLRTLIDRCYVVRFATDAIWIQNGHETFIAHSFLGQHITAGADPGERNFSGTGIRLMGNDNAVTDVVIFSAATGILVAGQANTLSGVHCYNKATGFGGTGIYLKSPGLTQTRIVNCYLDYTGIVSEDPFQLHVSGSFFLGDAGVVLKSVNGVISGVNIVDNMFSGSDNGVQIVRLDEAGGAFKAVDQVVVERNSAKGMTVRSTVARARVEGNGTTWTVDFSRILLFPNRIDHMQYTLHAVAAFPRHALRNVSGNRVVIESDVAVKATVYVAVGQCEESMV